MEAVQCRRCGEEWPLGDPALHVACPTCQAPPGRRCRRPSAHECVVHAARDGLATGMGLLTACPALTWDGRHAKPLPFPAPPQLTCTAPSPRSAPRQAPNAPQRRKDEAAPPSAWRILHPGKADITAPDAAAWLRWWTELAAKAPAEGKRTELRALHDANTTAWDGIALASPETEAVVAKAAQAVRTVLDG